MPFTKQWSPDESANTAVVLLLNDLRSAVIFGADDQWVSESTQFESDQLSDFWIVGSANENAETDQGFPRIRLSRQVETAPLDLTSLEEVIAAGREQCSTAVLANLIQTLKTLMRLENFQLIDQILGGQPWNRLSPEVMIALLRVTSPVKSKLLNWRSSVDAVKQELQERNLYNAEMLNGLR